MDKYVPTNFELSSFPEYRNNEKNNDLDFWCCRDLIRDRSWVHYRSRRSFCSRLSSLSRAEGAAWSLNHQSSWNLQNIMLDKESEHRHLRVRVIGITDLQWGSTYQTSLVVEWSKRGWMPNGLVFECNLNTGQMDTIFRFNKIYSQSSNPLHFIKRG